MGRMTRRQFGKRLAIAGALSALASSQVLGANERIRVGFIGVGNRGDQVLDAFLKQKDCQVVAVCDLYAPYRDFACRKIAQADAAASQVSQFEDYRQLLDRKDVDAVVICTPDHWHALQTIHAFQAGKDVFVEKPLSLCVVEGRKMVEACQRYRRVCQVGLHRRSSPFCQEVAQFLREGGIGQITRVRAFHIRNEWPKGIGRPPDEPPPKDLNWDAWLGPAPVKPYNRNRAFYRFRWFYDYSGGQLTNFGVHYLDMIHWCLGVDKPLAVTAMGGKFADFDNREVPDTLEVLWTYPGSKNSARQLPGRTRKRAGTGEFFPDRRQCCSRRGTTMRDRIPRHQRHTLSVFQRLRSCAGDDYAERSSGPHAAGSHAGTRIPQGCTHGDCRQKAEWFCRHRISRPQLPRLRSQPTAMQFRH
jgi:predicted dehydrogenase